MQGRTSEASSRKGYDIVADYLREAGISTIFTLGSGAIMRCIANVEERGDIRVVHAHHEQGAVAMADGFSRVSGEIGVALVGRGPAIAQTGTGLLTARRKGSNVLVVVPDSGLSHSNTPLPDSSNERYDLKSFDMVSFLESTVGNVININSHDGIIRNLRAAFRELQLGNGPVAVRIPVDTFLTDAAEVPEIRASDLVAPDPYGQTTATISPDADRIDDVVERFLDSDATKPPVILVGEGVVTADAGSAVEALAERMNALIIETLQARGYFRDHPYSLGMMGTTGTMLANEYAYRSNFVIAVGCSLNIKTTDSGRLFDEDATIVHIDVDEEAIERHTPVTVGLKGDARTVLRALDEALAAAGIERDGAFWTDALRRKIETAPTFSDHEFPEQPGTVDPRELMLALDEILPEERIVVVDGGMQKSWVTDGIRTQHPRDFVWTEDFHSTGLGLPMVVGVALGHPDKTPVAFCGDAGAMMSLSELHTSIRYDLPVIVIIIDDGGLGSERHTLARSNLYAESLLVESPDFAAVARAFGADAYTVRSLEDLARIEGTISRTPDGPTVVHCEVNQHVAHRTKL